MRFALVALLAVVLVGCKSDGGTGAGPGDASVDAAGPIAPLFGRPNDLTGLSATECKPACTTCGGNFTPPDYDAAFIQALVTDWQLATPFPEITTDPYAGPAPMPEPDGTVCAVLPGIPGTTPRPYTLVTYASATAAQAAGASVTHFGACGVCSTLGNLAVYMANNDLTDPVRQCGFDPMTDVACLQKLGFDLPCAEAWAFDTAHTRKACLTTCVALLGAPYNNPDGTLNACLQCDEDQSGPVFQAVAGRTRRNSGLPNAICRPCDQVQPLVHAY